MRRERSSRLVAALAVGGVLATAACTGGAKAADPTTAAAASPAASRTTSSSATATAAGPPSPAASASTSPSPTRPDLAASFAALQRRLGGRVGLAFAPVGAGDHAVTVLGSWRSGSAWSTSKVPVSIAAIRDDGAAPDAATRRDVVAAITVSDNNAAHRLWVSLGSTRRAAAKVDAVLRSGGDGRTRMARTSDGSGFTPFGLTTWALADQARFAAGLPCVTGAGLVLALMGKVTSSHRWGLGTLQGARFKGGWGPGPSGRYLVRQLGVLRLADGSRMGVAVATLPDSGSFTAGTRQLTAVARWLARNLTSGGSAGC